MNQFYAQAIDIVTNPNLDYKKIVIEIAKKHPDVLVAVMPNVMADNVDAWHRDVISYIKGNKRVNAIKLVREKTNYGLKEAKDICDAVTVEMLDNGVYLPFINNENRHWYTRQTLYADQMTVYKTLCKAAGVAAKE